MSSSPLTAALTAAMTPSLGEALAAQVALDLARWWDRPWADLDGADSVHALEETGYFVESARIRAAACGLPVPDLRARCEACASALMVVREHVHVDARAFFVDGEGPFTYAQMRDANGGDYGVLDWLVTAKPGDRFDDGGGIECRSAS